MSFNIRKFNNSEVPFNAKDILGKLIFQGWEENFKILDGEAYDYATHANLFSEKLDETVPLKLEEGVVTDDIPFNSEVEVVGQANLWIYDYEDTAYRGGTPVDIKAQAFSLRAENVKSVNKNNQPKPQPQEHKQG